MLYFFYELIIETQTEVSKPSSPRQVKPLGSPLKTKPPSTPPPKPPSIQRANSPTRVLSPKPLISINQSSNSNTNSKPPPTQPSTIKTNNLPPSSTDKAKEAVPHNYISDSTLTMSNNSDCSDLPDLPNIPFLANKANNLDTIDRRFNKKPRIPQWAQSEQLRQHIARQNAITQENV